MRASDLVDIGEVLPFLRGGSFRVDHHPEQGRERPVLRLTPLDCTLRVLEIDARASG
ncbi:MAG: hypothetical protein M3P06_11255 [Acidobacteriota bacterium]|nr:hypothetical protein [Acidobacteriota bacterium]